MLPMTFITYINVRGDGTKIDKEVAAIINTPITILVIILYHYFVF